MGGVGVVASEVVAGDRRWIGIRVDIGSSKRSGQEFGRLE